MVKETAQGVKGWLLSSQDLSSDPPNSQKDRFQIILATYSVNRGIYLDKSPAFFPPACKNCWRTHWLPASPASGSARKRAAPFWIFKCRGVLCQGQSARPSSKNNPAISPKKLPWLRSGSEVATSSPTNGGGGTET